VNPSTPAIGSGNLPNKPPTYHRQRLLLFFLDQAGGELTKLDLQKLLFLYTQESGSGHYAFVPYRFGCYSFLLKDDLDLLEKRGWLTIKDHLVALSAPLINAKWAKNSPTKRTVGRWLRNKSSRGDELIKEVYLRFPWYATRSELKKRLLNKDELAKVTDAQTQLDDQQTLFTLGYEGIQFEEYLNRLLVNNIKLVCDVRRNPLSRKFGFSGKTLATILPKIGIEYIHLATLGIDSSLRKNLTHPSDYQALFTNYRATLEQQQPGELGQIMDLLNKHKRVALTCFEQLQQSCHRHCITDFLKQQQPIAVIHL